jgi:hypothetical protein
MDVKGAASKLLSRGVNHLSSKGQPEAPGDQTPDFDPNMDDGISLYMPKHKEDPVPFFVSSRLRSSEADRYAMFKCLDLECVGAFRLHDGDLDREEIETVLQKFGFEEAQMVKFFTLCSLDEGDLKLILFRGLTTLLVKPQMAVLISSNSRR